MRYQIFLNSLIKEWWLIKFDFWGSLDVPTETGSGSTTLGYNWRLDNTPLIPEPSIIIPAIFLGSKKKTEPKSYLLFWPLNFSCKWVTSKKFWYLNIILVPAKVCHILETTNLLWHLPKFRHQETPFLLWISFMTCH